MKFVWLNGEVRGFYTIDSTPDSLLIKLVGSDSKARINISKKNSIIGDSKEEVLYEAEVFALGMLRKIERAKVKLN